MLLAPGTPAMSLWSINFVLSGLRSQCRSVVEKLDSVPSFDSSGGNQEIFFLQNLEIRKGIGLCVK